MDLFVDDWFYQCLTLCIDSVHWLIIFIHNIYQLITYSLLCVFYPTCRLNSPSKVCILGLTLLNDIDVENQSWLLYINQICKETADYIYFKFI